MRLSVGAKIGLTSTLLVMLVIAFLGYFQQRAIRDQHSNWATERRATFEQTADRLAESSANVLAVAVSEHLQGTEIAELELVVKQIVHHDDRVVLVRLADHLGKVLADSTKSVDPAELEVLPQTKAELHKPHAEEITVQGKQVTLVRRPILVSPEPGKAPDTLVGVVMFGYDLTPLQESLAEIDTQKDEAVSKSMAFTLKSGAIALLVGLILSLLQALRFSRPIKRLAETTAQIAEGDLGARVRVTQRDEIGALGNDFNHMADQVQRLLVESVAKAEMERELNLAREIQTVLVPGPGTHLAPGIEVAGHYEPASTCGGDFWDLASLPRGRSSILIGDVTGHGVPAAILTATAKGCIDTLRHVQGENIQVAETMRVLDRVIHEAGHGTFFMTAAAMVLDAAQGALYYSAAAHPPGLLLRWTESGTKLSRLSARGNRLGDGDAAGFEARRIRVVKGDLVVWYTDGLTDAVNADGNPYTTRRLLKNLARLDSAASAQQVVETIVKDLTKFRGDTPLEDDVTLVIGRIS